MLEEIEGIHEFWFGSLDELGMSPPEQNALWFKSSAETDQLCAERFGHLVEQSLGGGLQDWESNDRGLIALILLLDQLPRNIHRGTRLAFAGDPRALALAQHFIAHGHHQRLPAIHQVFLFLPLEHSEDIEIQEECVELFRELAGVTGLEAIEGYMRYAVAHRDVIRKFDRFPHRNIILGRESSPDELAYLQTHGGF
ncbi:MAG: DUF924 family protein [Halioglobus sp.]